MKEELLELMASFSSNHQSVLVFGFDVPLSSKEDGDCAFCIWYVKANYKLSISCIL